MSALETFGAADCNPPPRPIAARKPRKATAMNGEHDKARAWREAMGLSRAELSRLIGYGQSSIADLESGKYRATGRPIDPEAWLRYRLACAALTASVLVLKGAENGNASAITYHHGGDRPKKFGEGSRSMARSGSTLRLRGSICWRSCPAYLSAPTLIARHESPFGLSN